MFILPHDTFGAFPRGLSLTNETLRIATLNVHGAWGKLGCDFGARFRPLDLDVIYLGKRIGLFANTNSITMVTCRAFAQS